MQKKVGYKEEGIMQRGVELKPNMTFIMGEHDMREEVKKISRF